MGATPCAHQVGDAAGERAAVAGQAGRGLGVVVPALVRGQQHARSAGRALDVLAHGAAGHRALVVAARVRVALHDLLPVLPPPARQAFARVRGSQ